MSEWTELEMDGRKIRYRKRPGNVNGYDVERWYEGRQEWGKARDVSARDWFSLGVLVGQREAGHED